MIIECKHCGGKVNEWDSVAGLCPACIGNMAAQDETIKILVAYVQQLQMLLLKKKGKNNGNIRT
jgi:hypothetical protein